MNFRQGIFYNFQGVLHGLQGVLHGLQGVLHGLIARIPAYDFIAGCVTFMPQIVTRLEEQTWEH